jgi:hypothetical protein
VHTLARKYLDVRRLRPDRGKTRKGDLLAEAKAFEQASLAGEFYDSFDVNSKNFMEMSGGTTHWIAECLRHEFSGGRSCVGHYETARPQPRCYAFAGGTHTMIHSHEDVLLSRITVNPEIFGGKPIVRGRRLAVEHVLGMLAAGDTPDGRE